MVGKVLGTVSDNPVLELLVSGVETGSLVLEGKDEEEELVGTAADEELLGGSLVSRVELVLAMIELEDEEEEARVGDEEGIKVELLVGELRDDE
mgnify:FL=1